MSSVAAPTEQLEGIVTAAGVEPISLADAVRNALIRTEHGWLKRIVVETESGVVVLRGRVPSYYLKQMAQVTVMAVSGVELLRNELEVEGG